MLIGNTTFYQAKRGIVQDGLVLNIDAGVRDSVSGTGIMNLAGSGSGVMISGAFVSTNRGGSIVFNGATTSVICSGVTPTGNSSRTVQFWTLPLNNLNSFVQLGNGGGGGQIYNVQYYWINPLNYLFTDGINVSNNLTISGSQLPSTGVWNHITFLNSGQNWYYYLNSVITLSGTFPINLNTIGLKCLIGRRDDVATASFVSGNISQVLVYNRALSSGEVYQNFQATRYRFGV